MTELQVEWQDVPDPEPEPPQVFLDLIAAANRGEISDEGEFAFGTYLRGIDPDALLTSEGRRELCREDPLAFALTYLPHHLQSKATNNQITFAQLHVALMDDAKEWVHGTGKLRQYRDCYVAARDSGKTTWLFLVNPLWAAAYEYFKFVAAYSDSADQARIHLGTFRNELETNELLRWDFLPLCTGKTFGKSTRLVSQRQDKLEQANGFIFVAKGMTGSSLGLKIGNRRPELIILDDIEPSEENYSTEACASRLEALRSKILYQNQNARIIMVGTVTMPGSIIHQLVESHLNPGEETESPEWIAEENFKVHYFAPILTDDEDNQRSCWPEKWPLEFLLAHEHERQYRKNFLNQPVNDSGDYWSPEDITYLHDDFLSVRTILQIDPAVTSHRLSDYTGMSVISYDPKAGRVDAVFRSLGLRVAAKGKCLVQHVRQVKLGPKGLRKAALEILELFPEISLIRIESNQGGDTWFAVYHDMPIPVATHTESVNKELRTVGMLTHYQAGRVIHAKRFRRYEDKLLAYPNVLDDDEIDAVSAGVEYFLKPRQPKQVGSARSVSYV